MAKAVKVRVAVGIDKDGNWNAYGGANATDEDALSIAAEPLKHGEARYWLTAELAIPEEKEVSADVQNVT